MIYSKLAAILAGAAFGAASCGGKSLAPATSDAGVSDAGVSDAGVSDAGVSDAGVSDAGVSDAGVSNLDAGVPGRDAGRVPKKHRVSRTPCPTERGSVTPSSDGCPVDAGNGRCAQDSDCAAGINGRCEDVGSCPSDCSYDDCLQDSDCTDQTPCGCRLSAADSNRCYTMSNCSVDSDCSSGNYCSPSLVDRACIGAGDSYTAGYFCHTERDGCLDDSDCPNAGPCAFDRSEQRFSCPECMRRL